MTVFCFRSQGLSQGYMAPEMLEASVPEWVAWRPENFGPACLKTENRVPVNPWSENPAAEAESSPQTNQGRPESLHVVPGPAQECLIGRPCQARHLFHRR